MLIKKISHSYLDYPDNTAIYGSVALYVQGCDFSCKGCFNREFKKHCVTNSSFEETLIEIRSRGKLLPNKEYTHVVFLGGDPLSTQNRDTTIEFSSRLKDLGFKVAIYTGLEYSEVINLGVICDYVKCGKFNINKTQISGHRDGKFFLASTNQILLDSKMNILSIDGVYNYNQKVK